MISPTGTAGAQKDVIIRLRLVGDKSNVSVADDLSKTVDVIGQKAAEASKQLGKVLQGNVDDLGRSIAKLSSEDVKRSQAVNSVSTSIGQSLRRQEDALESVGKKATETSREMAEGSEKAGTAAEKQAATFKKLGEEQFNAMKASVTAGKGALQGVLDVTEGLSVLGITSEESLEKFNKGFAQVQAGFKVFKGGLDIVVEGVTAYRELSRVIKTAAIANELLAASQTKVAVTSVAASAAQGAAGAGVVAGGVRSTTSTVTNTALGLGTFEGIRRLTKHVFGRGTTAAASKVGFGQILKHLATRGSIAGGGLIAGGVTKVGRTALDPRLLGGIALAETVQGFRRMSEGGEFFSTQEGTLKNPSERGRTFAAMPLSTESPLAAASFFANLTNLKNVSRSGATFLGSPFGFGEPGDALTDSIEKQRAGRQLGAGERTRAFRDRFHLDTANRNRSLSFQENMIDLRSPLATTDDERRQFGDTRSLEKRRLQIGELAVAESKLLEVRKEIHSIDASQFTGEERRERELIALEGIHSVHQRIADIDRERAETARQIAGEMASQVDAQRKQVELAQKAVEAEKERFTGAKARFGALGEADQAAIGRIAEKVSLGQQISVAEAKFLKQSGFGSKIADKRLAQEVDARDLAALETLGEKKGVTDAQTTLADEQAKLTDAQSKAADSVTEMNKATEVAAESLRTLSKAAGVIATIQSDKQADASTTGPGYSRGGVVPGVGRGDRVPARLEPGEVVLRNKAVDQLGRAKAIDANKNPQRYELTTVQGFADGGEIPGMRSPNQVLAEILADRKNRDRHEVRWTNTNRAVALWERRRDDRTRIIETNRVKRDALAASREKARQTGKERNAGRAAELASKRQSRQRAFTFDRFRKLGIDPEQAMAAERSRAEEEALDRTAFRKNTLGNVAAGQPIVAEDKFSLMMDKAVDIARTRKISERDIRTGRSDAQAAFSQGGTPERSARAGFPQLLPPTHPNDPSDFGSRIGIAASRNVNSQLDVAARNAPAESNQHPVEPAGTKAALAEKDMTGKGFAVPQQASSAPPEPALPQKVAATRRSEPKDFFDYDPVAARERVDRNFPHLARARQAAAQASPGFASSSAPAAGSIQPSGAAQQHAGIKQNEPAALGRVDATVSNAQDGIDEGFDALIEKIDERFERIERKLFEKADDQERQMTELALNQQ